MERPYSYKPQLDGLRAFAVGAVLYHHFWAGTGFGHLGVRLFFVLSGFLISNILLRERAAVKVGRAADALRTFYIRRMLRIFPAYYAAITAAFLLGIGDVRETFLWHAAYASNILFSIRGEWPEGTAHLWSLSIEEQFYLVWPFVMLFLPRNRLAPVFVAMIVFAGVFRLAYFGAASSSGPAIWVATPAALDAFAVGALLSLWLTGPPRLSAGASALLFLPAFALAFGFAYVASPGQQYVVGEFLWLIPIAFLIIAAHQGLGGIAGRLLDNPAVVYIGRISYGIYLYHLFVPPALMKVGRKLGIEIVYHDGPLKFLVMGSVTIVLATLSWFLFENPINGLKRNFAYDGRPEAAWRLNGKKVGR